jgi:hypothetical protein
MDSGRFATLSPGMTFRNSSILLETERAVARCHPLSLYISRRYPLRPSQSSPTRGKSMVVTAAHITPIVAVIAGLLILIIPRLLNYIVALYLIFVGLVELNAIHHWVNFH